MELHSLCLRSFQVFHLMTWLVQTNLVQLVTLFRVVASLHSFVPCESPSTAINQHTHPNATGDVIDCRQINRPRVCRLQFVDLLGLARCGPCLASCILRSRCQYSSAILNYYRLNRIAVISCLSYQPAAFCYACLPCGACSRTAPSTSTWKMGKWTGAPPTSYSRAAPSSTSAPIRRQVTD